MAIQWRHLFLPALLALAPCGRATSADNEPEARPVCEASSPSFDSSEVSCAIPASATPRRYEFRARFAGGHDDTLVRIELGLDEAPLTCEPGSKTRAFAEDGDITLSCAFPVAPRTGQPVTLKAVVRWSHAQYSGYDFRAR